MRLFDRWMGGATERVPPLYRALAAIHLENGGLVCAMMLVAVTIVVQVVLIVQLQAQASYYVVPGVRAPGSAVIQWGRRADPSLLRGPAVAPAAGSVTIENGSTSSVDR